MTTWTALYLDSEGELAEPLLFDAPDEDVALARAALLSDADHDLLEVVQGRHLDPQSTKDVT